MPLDPLAPGLSTLEIVRHGGVSDACNALLLWLERAVRANPRFRRGGVELTAQDIAGDALMRAMCSETVQSGRFESRGVGAFRGYVRSMIDSVIADEVSRRLAHKRGGRLVHEPLSDSYLPSQLRERDPRTPSREVSGREQVDRQLARLDPLEREVVILHVYERCDFPEIAARLGGSDSSHRSRFDRARRKLLRGLAPNSDCA
ncbi:MAG: sigma-70 family RNA polymerase sigma factor [Planctomycetes bacterium]|nr:sigma-70 family RNA polymerase sigma factor [Planctomycetota bacterium]